MEIDDLVREFVDNAREDREEASKTYMEYVGNELLASTSASFFRAKQEANKQLLEAANMLLREKEHALKAKKIEGESDDDLSDLYSKMENAEDK